MVIISACRVCAARLLQLHYGGKFGGMVIAQRVPATAGACHKLAAQLPTPEGYPGCFLPHHASDSKAPSARQVKRIDTKFPGMPVTDVMMSPSRSPGRRLGLQRMLLGVLGRPLVAHLWAPLNFATVLFHCGSLQNCSSEEQSAKCNVQHKWVGSGS